MPPPPPPSPTHPPPQTRAAEEALAQGEALRKHLEATLLKDLGGLGPDALRQRVVQLAGELQERTKWEVRLSRWNGRNRHACTYSRSVGRMDGRSAGRPA
jgi:hypothetical protein